MRVVIRMTPFVAAMLTRWDAAMITTSATALAQMNRGFMRFPLRLAASCGGLILVPEQEETARRESGRLPISLFQPPRRRRWDLGFCIGMARCNAPVRCVKGKIQKPHLATPDSSRGGDSLSPLNIRIVSSQAGTGRS